MSDVADGTVGGSCATDAYDVPERAPRPSVFGNVAKREEARGRLVDFDEITHARPEDRRERPETREPIDRNRQDAPELLATAPPTHQNTK